MLMARGHFLVRRGIMYSMSTRYQRYSELSAGVPSMTVSQNTFSKDIRWFEKKCQPSFFQSKNNGEKPAFITRYHVSNWLGIPDKEKEKHSAKNCTEWASPKCKQGNCQASDPVLVLSLKDNWIGLDLFNDDTRPSGHISRPAQVNVSQSGFHSLNNYSSLIILYTSGG